MKFEIDMGKLRGAILKRKGLRSFEMMAAESDASVKTLHRICNNQNKEEMLVSAYFSICHWLGVSAYHFMKKQYEPNTINDLKTYKEKYNDRED